MGNEGCRTFWREWLKSHVTKLVGFLVSDRRPRSIFRIVSSGLFVPPPVPNWMLLPEDILLRRVEMSFSCMAQTTFLNVRWMKIWVNLKWSTVYSRINRPRGKGCVSNVWSWTSISDAITSLGSNKSWPLMTLQKLSIFKQDGTFKNVLRFFESQRSQKKKVAVWNPCMDTWTNPTFHQHPVPLHNSYMYKYPDCDVFGVGNGFSDVFCFFYHTLLWELSPG